MTNSDKRLGDRDALDRIAYNAALSATDDLIACRAEVARLTAALKAMVSEVRKFHPTFDARIFVQAERALSHPTTEPAKAEEA